MLIACPDCAREVSDRAAACPQCGFPIAEHLAEQRAIQEAADERTTRERTELWTDCAPCKGRGFEMFKWTDDEGNPRQAFGWCERCGHVGQLPVLRSAGGYFTMPLDKIDAFVAGELDREHEDVTALGPDAPPPPTYPAQAGRGEPREASDDVAQTDASASPPVAAPPASGTDARRAPPSTDDESSTS